MCRLWQTILLVIIWTSSQSESAIFSGSGLGRPQSSGRVSLLDNLVTRVIQAHRFSRKSVCYEQFGCFSQRGQLRPAPLPPQLLATKLWLCSRGQGKACSLVEGRDSLRAAGFQPSLPVKVLVHGYGGKHTSPHILAAKDRLLLVEDVSVVLVDWRQGGGVSSYRQAVSNAELVGRQVAQLLLVMASLGANPSGMHVVGFSLGAQVAGYVGYALQQAGLQLGRITGLDPASFLFEWAQLPASRKLDHTDAHHVEVIHTDGSRIWSDGFGLLGPVGHVDYFPNGGINQPGCKDSVLGALTYQLNKKSNSTTICSHARAWELYLETIQTENGCSFLAVPCSGLKDFDKDFIHGNCFANCTEASERCGVMGTEGPRGLLYLVTQNSKPYCGQQVRASVKLSPKTQLTRGKLELQVQHGNKSTHFNLNSALLNVVNEEIEMSTVVAIDFNSINVQDNTILDGKLIFTPAPGMHSLGPQHLFIDRVSITDLKGNSWQNCKGFMLEDRSGTESDSISFQLPYKICS